MATQRTVRVEIEGCGDQDELNGEALLVAAGQNLKRLLSRQGWDRRPWPSGAAGLVLPTPAPAPTALG